MDGARDQPLWRPSPEQAAATNLAHFMDEAGKRWNKRFSGMAELHRWSVEAPEEFWRSVWDWGGVISETQGQTVLRDGDKMPGAQFFPEARLNYAENLLRKRDPTDALVFRGEDKVKRRLSWAQLYDQVSLLAQAMKADGIGPGDRVAGYLPNMPEAVIGMLAASSLGAVWSSCSPDFGVKGVSVPVAVSAFPDELYQCPRNWAESAYPKLIHYNKLPKGGHFAAWEQPKLFSEEVRAGFRSLR